MYRIGIGSKTSTGGVVIEGNANIIINGLVASSVGHRATCPACKKGIGPIVAVGPRNETLPAGLAARSGDYIACGCPPGSNVLLPDGNVLFGAYSGSSDENDSEIKPLPAPFIFAKSSSVPMKSIDASTSTESHASFGKVMVLAPLPASHSR
jgi:uncharacterized Zn-binding protein involved in type VI secretion